MERGPSHLDLHTEELVVGITLRPSLHYNVEASASILLAHDGIINAVPLLTFRVLPGLLRFLNQVLHTVASIMERNMRSSSPASLARP